MHQTEENANKYKMLEYFLDKQKTSAQAISSDEPLYIYIYAELSLVTYIDWMFLMIIKKNETYIDKFCRMCIEYWSFKFFDLKL